MSCIRRPSTKSAQPAPTTTKDTPKDIETIKANLRAAIDSFMRRQREGRRR